MSGIFVNLPIWRRSWCAHFATVWPVVDADSWVCRRSRVWHCPMPHHTTAYYVWPFRCCRRSLRKWRRCASSSACASVKSRRPFWDWIFTALWICTLLWFAIFRTVCACFSVSLMFGCAFLCLFVGVRSAVFIFGYNVMCFLSNLLLFAVDLWYRCFTLWFRNFYWAFTFFFWFLIAITLISL